MRGWSWLLWLLYRSNHPPVTICAPQDSLLEITLRSRVIEKLSVALDVCLFQHERDPYLETKEDMEATEVRSILSHRVRTSFRSNGM